MDGFHGVWLHFKVVKEVLHRVLTTSAKKIKEAAFLKVKGLLYSSCLLIALLPSVST